MRRILPLLLVLAAVPSASAAAELTRDVDRPDLLLVSALLHDIGKGWPGDHSEVGEPIAATIATRTFTRPPVDHSSTR